MNLFRIISFLVVIQKACQGVSHVFSLCVPKTSQNAVVFHAVQESYSEEKKKIGQVLPGSLSWLNYLTYVLIFFSYSFCLYLSLSLLKYICVC